MKKSDELKQKRAGLFSQAETLAGKDQLSAEERTSFESLNTQIESLNSEIEFEEKREQLLANAAALRGQPLNPKDEKDISKFSFSRAMRALAEGRTPDGLEGEMHQEGVNERKSLGISTKGFAVPMMVLQARASTGQNVTEPADGGRLVAEEIPVFIESLKNKLVLTQLGANFITNLTGNLPLLKGGSFSAAWVPEGGNVNFSKTAFGKATMTPKNLMVAGAISKQLLVQTADVADRLIREELIKAIAHGLQAAAINGSGQDAQPYGILNTVGIGAVIGGENGAIPAWSHIVNLESEIANDNADLGEIKYLTNTKVRGILKQTLRSAGVSGYIWEGTQMNGYQALTSNVVPSNLEKGTSSVCSAIIAGVWSELFIGMWGGLDIVVDPFTRADFNEIKLVLNQFADVALRNAEAFAAMKDALTA